MTNSGWQKTGVGLPTDGGRQIDRVALWRNSISNIRQFRAAGSPLSNNLMKKAVLIHIIKSFV